jgi:alpha-amylase
LSTHPSIFYQVFVRSFADFNQDGIGDLRGIIHKLDYLVYLGVEGIWLSPIFTSPSYHKYDVSNYFTIDPEYGSMQDFEELVQEANKRSIKIILDLVVSHTSIEHPWFVEAQSSEDSPYRDYYIWKSPQRIKQLNLAYREATEDTGIEKPWHRATGNTEKYYGIFSKGMPDLNLENLKTRIEILEIARFWMRKGVYGFRLDAAKHLYPAWSNTEKNIAFWQALREELEKDFGQIFLVGEVWSKPVKVAPFFKGLHANFNFELCFDLRDALKAEWDHKNLIKNLLMTYEIYAKENPNFIDATFLGNHDQERIASLLKGNKLKAAINLLMTLPGNPFLYYGEELGTEGKKPDKRLREPFIWNYINQDYFRTEWTRGVYSNEKRLHPLAIQSADENSIFSHYRKMIAFRKSQAALCQVCPVNIIESGIDDPALISFIRTNPKQNLLIIQNITKVNRDFEHNFDVKEVLLSTQKSRLSDKKINLGPFGLLVLDLSR